MDSMMIYAASRENKLLIIRSKNMVPIHTGIINTSYQKLPFGSGDYPWISSYFTKH